MASKTPSRTTSGRKSAKESVAKEAPRLTRYSKGEYIKVAPLHSLKPTIAINDVQQSRLEPSDADLFDGHPPAAADALGDNLPPQLQQDVLR